MRNVVYVGVPFSEQGPVVFIEASWGREPLPFRPDPAFAPAEGHEWGYTSSNTRGTAFSLLADVVGDKVASKLAGRFVDQVVGRRFTNREPFEITSQEIAAWVNAQVVS